MSPTDVAILVPMRGRPDHVGPLLASLEGEPRASVVFAITDRDDAVERLTRDHRRVILPTHGRGDYAKKINAAYRATTEPLLFLGASDLRFHAGWLDACLAVLTEGVGVVGTNDMCNPRTISGQHSTHSLVTREYVERYGTADEPGIVLHEGYWHEMVDDEFVETAKARSAYAHAFDAHVEHVHWMNGSRPRDAVDADYERRMMYGRRVLRRRRLLWRR